MQNNVSNIVSVKVNQPTSQWGVVATVVTWKNEYFIFGFTEKEVFHIEPQLSFSVSYDNVEQ